MDNKNLNENRTEQTIHKAVALKYPEGAVAPIIMAKGKGKTADLIISEAQKNDIYIKEDTALVDLLGLQETGDVVPEEAWKALAAIFAFILEEK